MGGDSARKHLSRHRLLFLFFVLVTVLNGLVKVIFIFFPIAILIAGAQDQSY